jgi:hypothetical protein
VVAPTTEPAAPPPASVKGYSHATQGLDDKRKKKKRKGGAAKKASTGGDGESAAFGGNP